VNGLCSADDVNLALMEMELMASRGFNRHVIWSPRQQRPAREPDPQAEPLPSRVA